MEKNTPDNLSDFFSLVKEEKRKKDEEKKQLIGEISLETMFQDIAVETARVKKELQEKEKEKEEARKKLVADAKIFENFLFSEPKKKIKKKAKKDDYEELKQEIGSKEKPVKPAVDEIATEETTADHAIKILDTINEKTGKEIIKENTTESEIAKLRKELDVLKQAVFTQGGGGEVNLKYLDDIVGIATNASAYNGMILSYDHDINKFKFVEQAGAGSTTWATDSVGIHTISSVGIATNAANAGYKLDVGGNARITGILTVGTDTIVLDGSSNTINVGTGITLDAANETITVGGAQIADASGQGNYTGIVTAAAFVGPLTGNVDGTTGTFSGDVSATNATFTGDVSIGGTLTYEDVTSVDVVGLITARSGIDLGGSNIVRIDGATSTKTSTAQASIDTFDAETYSAATYQVQVKRGSDYHTSSINLVHAGGTVYISEYGTIKTGASLASFDADLNSGNIRLLATPTSSDSTVFKVFRTTMNA